MRAGHMDQGIARRAKAKRSMVSAHRRSGVREDRELLTSGITKPRNPKLSRGKVTG
jgi:hypothetical protein